MPFFVFTKKVAKIILKQKTSPLLGGDVRFTYSTR